jgi:Icc-related predicted phosphoesterase
MRNKIFFCGDPHGEFGHILSAIEEYHPAAVVILGDLTPPKSLDEIFKDIGATQVFWIPGNHDTDSDLIYDRLWRSRFAKQNLNGKVLDVGPLKVGGLGGVFRGQVWMPPAVPNYTSPTHFIHKLGKNSMWRGGLPRRHRSTIFNSLYERLAGMKADVLVTHEAPSSHPKGFAEIDMLARRMGVRYVFHAHQHQSMDYGEIDGVVTRGIGLRGIIDIDGNVIVPAQIDERELQQISPQEKEQRPGKAPRAAPQKPRRANGPRRGVGIWINSRRRRMESREPGNQSGHFHPNQNPSKE